MGKKKSIKQERQRRVAKRARRKQRHKESSLPSEPKQTDIPNIPDRRIMERHLADMTRLIEKQGLESVDEINAYLANVMASGGVPPSVPQTPLEEAQNLMYDAWEASSTKDRVRIARQALEISPDCADAYVLLAEEEARNIHQARQLYQEGVEAGERALGKEFFEENEGHFWGIMETRPYMRARAGLAQVLIALDKHEAAIGHFRDMLRLNPGDNQGNRYELLSCLMNLGRDDDAEELLAQYEDDAMSDWLYSRALIAFRRGGDCAEAKKYLQEALEENGHVPDYLLGRKQLPRSFPSYITWGGDSEAVSYTARFFEGWRRTPGALDWLSGQVR